VGSGKQRTDSGGDHAGAEKTELIMAELNLGVVQHDLDSAILEFTNSVGLTSSSNKAVEAIIASTRGDESILEDLLFGNPGKLKPREVVVDTAMDGAEAEGRNIIRIRDQDRSGRDKTYWSSARMEALRFFGL
jgi:hypothetical protein